MPELGKPGTKVGVLRQSYLDIIGVKLDGLVGILDCIAV